MSLRHFLTDLKKCDFGKNRIENGNRVCVNETNKKNKTKKQKTSTCCQFQNFQILLHLNILKLHIKEIIPSEGVG